MRFDAGGGNAPSLARGDPQSAISTMPGVRPCTRRRGSRGTRRTGRSIGAHEMPRLPAQRASGARARTAIIRLLLLTGCRKGEIVHLRWSEVHRDALVLADSKTGARKVPLNSQARSILEQQPRDASPFVFPSPLDPSRPRSYALSLWHRVRRQADIEDVRLHDLRHTCASWPDLVMAKEVIDRWSILCFSLFPKSHDITSYNPKSYSHRIHSNVWGYSSPGVRPRVRGPADPRTRHLRIPRQDAAERNAFGSSGSTQQINGGSP